MVQQNCQYSGLPQEEPTEFLAQFLQIADIVRDKEVDQDVYRLFLFPFAVKDQAKRWLNNQPSKHKNMETVIRQIPESILPSKTDDTAKAGHPRL